MGSDKHKLNNYYRWEDFNPRSPCGERRLFLTGESGNGRFQSTLPVWGATSMYPDVPAVFVFQSTLPVWGATAPKSGNASRAINFNPRSPCGERRGRIAHRRRGQSISIHAPRVGSDSEFYELGVNCGDFNPRSPCGERLCRSRHLAKVRVFQSTLPVWGATKGPEFCIQIIEFQSTLPVWGATKTVRSSKAAAQNFNPRSPCGERHSRRVH